MGCGWKKERTKSVEHVATRSCDSSSSFRIGKAHASDTPTCLFVIAACKYTEVHMLWQINIVYQCCLTLSHLLPCFVNFLRIFSNLYELFWWKYHKRYVLLTDLCNVLCHWQRTIKLANFRVIFRFFLRIIGPKCRINDDITNYVIAYIIQTRSKIGCLCTPLELTLSGGKKAWLHNLSHGISHGRTKKLSILSHRCDKIDSFLVCAPGTEP